MNADAGKGHSGGGGGLPMALYWQSFTNKNIKDLYGSYPTNKKEKSCVTMSDFFLKNHLINITSF